ncbi:hypothetical protein [Okeania sp. SIO1I7]|nr:hypothetical protein [Okeania sp. SIO1I7]
MWCGHFVHDLYQFDKCLLQMVEVRKKEEGRRKKGKILKKREKR